ncbi:alpha/beta hydrolase [Flavobacterium defluvii]|uniref:Acetyl esterase/lipase n=1 Tax=Flavobacterium defluvii TaxID=370979 RepID=A0A1M5VK00_9FLAO|nr:alpha/beta hydrolase [Flavobacterium defluvii]SHH75518.1 Acetyl esterase/lipase [Flavobacterium defluvii]
MRKIVLILFLLSSLINAQQTFSVDTSYTIKSTYTKLIKKYPSITIPAQKKSKNLIENTNVVYFNENGRALHFDAFVYNTKKQNPAVIIIHGGGWRSGNKNQMNVFAEEIADKGYSCFTIEYRLSPEAKYPNGVYDVKNAIRFIKDNAKKFKVDTDKITVLGCSSGGQMASLIGTTNENPAFDDPLNKSKSSSKVNAIINIDGVLAFRHPESSEGEMASFWLGGSYEQKTENWKNASALSHTNKNTPPILFINSSIDRFHAGRDDMIKILNQYKIYNEVHTIENSPHSFWFFQPWFDQTIFYTTNFLNKIFK